MEAEIKCGLMCIFFSVVQHGSWLAYSAALDDIYTYFANKIPSYAPIEPPPPPFKVFGRDKIVEDCIADVSTIKTAYSLFDTAAY